MTSSCLPPLNMLAVSAREVCNNKAGWGNEYKLQLFFFFPGVFLHCSYSFKTSAQPRFTLLWYVPGNKGAIPMLHFPGMRVQSITGRALDKCISYWALLQILERDLVAIFCKWKNHVVWKLWWGWKPWSARRATGVEPWLAGVKLEWSSLTG